MHDGRRRGRVRRFPRAVRRQLTPTAVVAVVLAIAATAATVATRSDLQEARARAGANRLGLEVAKEVLFYRTASLLATSRQLSFTSFERDQFRAALSGTLTELDQAQSAMVHANGQIETQDENIGVLRTCLEGVNRALNASSVGDADVSAAALRDVGQACRAAEEIAGPPDSQFPFDFADPFVLRVGDRFYGYSTNAGGGNVQLIEADQLGAWQWVGNALPTLPGWVTPDRTWSPSVLAVEGGFVLYYTVREAASGRQCISMASSGSPAGPFVDNSAGPLVCQADLDGSIDPSPFVDADGRAYLLWRSEAVPARLWSQPLAPDGLSLVGAPAPLLVSDQRWEEGVVEAPAMVRPGGAGSYYLFYSARSWNSADYAMGYATCSGPVGPCTRVTTRGPFFATQPGVVGPGGEEFFTDTDGAVMVAFHAWADGEVGYPNRRRLHVMGVTFPGGVPTLAPV